MVTTLLIPADEDQPLEIVDMSSLADYQKAVGGYIEAIGARPPAVTFIVNEEGKLRGLPVNTRATALWWYLDERFVNADSLRGDVILAGPPDRAGKSQRVPQDLAVSLVRANFRVELQAASDERWHPVALLFKDMFTAMAFVVDMRAQLPSFATRIVPRD